MKILTFLLIATISEALCGEWSEGLCQGIHMGATHCNRIYINGNSKMSCEQKCSQSCHDSINEGCRWVSYDNVDNVCHKHKTCRTTYVGKLFEHYSHFDVKEYKPIASKYRVRRENFYTFFFRGLQRPIWASKGSYEFILANN